MVVPDVLREKNKIIALAGNPNVGKSTLFNRLTGMKQHTGNWPGKTVTNAIGILKDKKRNYVFVDIPGTYSLLAHSEEERVARNFLCFGAPDAVVVVCDATCLERNLNLALQAIEIGIPVIICVNLLDEARKKGIAIDCKQLSRRLGVPVVGISARSGEGVGGLLREIDRLWKKENNISSLKITYPLPIENAVSVVNVALQNKANNTLLSKRFLAIKLLQGEDDFLTQLYDVWNISAEYDLDIKEALQEAKSILSTAGIPKEKLEDYLVSGLVLTAEDICDEKAIRFTRDGYWKKDFYIDRILTGKFTGTLTMLLLLAGILWLTISGANMPSALLWQMFSKVEEWLFVGAEYIGLPSLISEMLISGVYRVLAWVVSVMLPPMAIFFPLFTLLEDVGYLPRVAFNLDRAFSGCAACGKQAPTMCMGFGCNAAGVTGCRIIDSPRERLVAVLTNNFVPCNGRFPTIIALISMFFVSGITAKGQSLFATCLLLLVILFGIGMTFLTSKLLSVTLLRGQASSFTLELPPYRRPKIGSVLVRSMLDRTVFVLGRAVLVAAPAGLIIWLMANITVADATLLEHCSNFLDPLGRLMGMDGVILLGFILGFPANEIVIPIIMMAYLSNGTLSDYGSIWELKELLVANGWTVTTALCTMIFSLFHWPCSTTLLTIKKETGSWGWTAIAFLIPTVIGMLICMFIAFISRTF